MGLEIFKRTICGILALLLVSPPILAEQRTIAILAPKANQELSNVFELIIDGIKQNTPQFDKEIRLLTDDNPDEIKKWLINNKFLAVVTIGNKTTDFADSLSISVPIITTATLFSAENNYNQTPPSITDEKSHNIASSITEKKNRKTAPISIAKDKINGGVSLSIAEETLKNTLRLYLPHIKKLYIGDEGGNIIWFSDELSFPQIIKQKISHEQKSIVQYLWKTINQVDPKTEAVWVNNNIEHIFLYKLSERAWERNVTLISNNISHLESGTLLAIYPDFKGMGQRTGDLLTTLIEQKKSRSLTLEPLTTIHRGINLRTAQHLGIAIPSAIENDFRVIIK